MTSYRWLIYLGIILVAVIIWDEFAYTRWKQLNPGAMWSGQRGRIAGLVDPSMPNTTYWEAE